MLCWKCWANLLAQTLYCCKPERLVPVKMAKPELLVPNENFGFQVHYGHSKGNTPDGEKPGAVKRTLKTEYHSLGQNNETSVTRSPATKKAGSPKGYAIAGGQGAAIYRDILQGVPAQI